MKPIRLERIPAVLFGVAMLSSVSLSAQDVGSATGEGVPARVVPGREANPQTKPLPAIEFRYSQLGDLLKIVLEKGGVKGYLCAQPPEWPWALVETYSTEGKDLRTVLEELSERYSFAWEWGPELLLIAPDVENLAWFRSRLDEVAPEPIPRGRVVVGSATEEYGPGMNVRVFRVTDDVGTEPESVFRRLEVIRGVVEILGIMLYGGGDSDPENPQRRIVYPQTREEEVRDPRFIGTITVIDTEENLRKVEDFFASAQRALFEFQAEYRNWVEEGGENPQERASPELFRPWPRAEEVPAATE